MSASANTMKIRPLSDRIVVQPEELETKTKGGIYIPDTADKDKPMRGKIIAIGNGKYIDGKIHPLQVQVGDTILFGKYSGTSIKLDDKELLVMREEDVMGVVEILDHRAIVARRKPRIILSYAPNCISPLRWNNS